ncbi:MAG: SHOCT domain-containing protein [Gaiellales bacterium]|nr:MAG: SHOCT domain-containing protein [Gaiellales bacterium]
MGIGLIFIVLLVVGVVLLMQNNGAARGLFNSDTAAQAETPLEILKKRYARGEIDTAEYEALRRELQ